jgi:glycosyltransferase involved in cell wall biosynthesis
LVLAGDYESDRFKSSYASLTQIAAELGLKDRVQFTGFVTDEQLARLYNQASVLTFPSLEEGFGLPAVEAMACGLPVIASNAHALAEIVGDAGLLVDPRSATAWCAAILEVLRNRAVSAELRSRSLARSARFSWKAAARRLELILDEIGKPGEA